MGARFRAGTVAVLLVAVLFVGVVAGCGRASGGDKHAAPPLSGMLLTQDDFPDGWSSTSHAPDPAAAARHAKLARCLGIADSTAHVTGSLTSDDFTLQGTRVWSTVSRLASQSDVTSDVAALRGRKFPGCAKDAFHELVSGNVPSAYSLKSLTVTVQTKVSGVPANVAASASAHFVLKSKHADATADGYYTVFYISGPHIEATVTITSGKTRMDASLQSQVITAVAHRVAPASKS